MMGRSSRTLGVRVNGEGARLDQLLGGVRSGVAGGDNGSVRRRARRFAYEGREEVDETVLTSRSTRGARAFLEGPQV